jgi:hypothetical protein
MVRFLSLFCCMALTFKFFVSSGLWFLFALIKSIFIWLSVNIHRYMSNKCIIIFGDTTYIYRAVRKKYLWGKLLHKWNPWTFSFISK